MKKTVSALLCLVAMATFGLASCEKDNDTDNSTDTTTKDLVVGTWQVDNMTLNGEQMTPENMLIIMNDNGTGLINDNGETENNDFRWTVEGKTLTITPHPYNHTYTYTLDNLTETECTFSGDNVPLADISGAVVVHMVRVR